MPDTKSIMRELIRQRLILAIYAISVASLALFTGHMSDVQWNIALGTILAAYGAAAWKNIE